MRKTNRNRFMKLMIFIFSLLFVSCSSNEKEKVYTKKANKDFEQTIENENQNKKLIKTELTFEDFQDSLRNVLLKSKTNEKLKSSILQELYIRGLVNQVDNLIIFKLPFDLHGFDCGAPDCYSTDITFNIPAKEPIEFPKIVDFHLREHGCVDKEISSDGKFELVELSPEYVNYYSITHKSNLIIIKNEGQLYYFPNTKPNTIKVSMIDMIFEKYDDDDPNSIVPYQSTKMTTYEYENFVENE
jgi:hypothetical protein